jgi:alpha-tubulin suppressor-like RCC1 family protein
MYIGGNIFNSSTPLYYGSRLITVAYLGNMSLILPRTIAGSMYAVGNNSLYQLGLGDVTNRTSYTQLSSNWTYAALGQLCTFILSGNKLYAVGNNGSGQLGLGDFFSKFSVTPLTGNWSKIFTRYFHSFALSGNRLYATGDNSLGQLGLGNTTTVASFTPLTGSWNHVSVGESHTFTMSGNRLYAAGYNANGQLGLGNTITTRTSLTALTGSWNYVACGYDHTLALSGNRLYATGSNTDGQLGVGDSTRRTTFTLVSGNWDYMAAGYNHSFALSGSKLYATGDNSSGQLGLGDIFNRTSFTQVPGDWSWVDCGWSYTLAVSSNGKLFATGENSSGQLGLGDTSDRLVFTQVPGDWDSVFCGNFHSFALSASSGGSVSLLLHMDGTNGSTTFTDSSRNNLSAARFGNANINTTIKKFGTGSAFFDGVGDYLYIQSNKAFGFENYDFTLEAWIYPTAMSFQDLTSIIDCRSAGFGANQGPALFLESSTRKVYFFDGSSNNGLTTNTIVPLSAWTHIAAQRTEGAWEVYINGIKDAATYNQNATLQSSMPCYIGTAADIPGVNRNFFGYMDEVRITKGTALYKSNFIVPFRAFPNTLVNTY